MNRHRTVNRIRTQNRSGTRTRILPTWLALLVIALPCIACSKSTPTASAVNQPVDPLLPPEQVKGIQAGLFSRSERQQLGALEALSSLPEMRKAFQTRIDELASSGSEPVQEAAKKLQAMR